MESEEETSVPLPNKWDFHMIELHQWEKLISYQQTELQVKKKKRHADAELWLHLVYKLVRNRRK